MFANAVLLFASLAILFFGAELLVRGSASAALRPGWTPLVVGLTVVAFGTSAPELVVSVGAALAGLGNIAVGNVVGSNIFNIGVILGASAAAAPIAAPGIGRLDLAVMVGFAVALFPLLYTGRRLLRWEGAVLLLGYGLYLWKLWPTG